MVVQGERMSVAGPSGWGLVGSTRRRVWIAQEPVWDYVERATAHIADSSFAPRAVN